MNPSGSGTGADGHAWTRAGREVRTVEQGAADPDLQLLTRIAASDQSAMMAFYDRHYGLVAGYCRKMVRDAAQADEAIQDTFLQVWRLASGFDPARARPTTWLFVLARSRCLDGLRRSGRRAEMEILDRFEEESGAAAAPSAPDPTATEAEHRVERVRVRHALSALPPEQSQALTGAYLLGMTADQIATLQNVPLGTAKTRIRLGLRRLRGLLEVDAHDA